MTFVTVVIDSTLTAPPGGESHGDCYIVGPAATGAWSGHDDELATYRDGSYEFTAPNDGEMVWDQSGGGHLKVWDTATWRVIGMQCANVAQLAITASNPPTQAEVQGTIDGVNDLIGAMAASSSGLMEEP